MARLNEIRMAIVEAMTMWTARKRSFLTNSKGVAASTIRSQTGTMKMKGIAGCLVYRVSNPKLQIPSSDALPNLNSHANWRLEVGSTLGFGAWHLGFDALVNDQNSPLKCPTWIHSHRICSSVRSSWS